MMMITMIVIKMIIMIMMMIVITTIIFSIFSLRSNSPAIGGAHARNIDAHIIIVPKQELLFSGFAKQLIAIILIPAMNKPSNKPNNTTKSTMRP